MSRREKARLFTLCAATRETYLNIPLDRLNASGSGGPAGLAIERPRVYALLGREVPPLEKVLLRAVPGRSGLEKDGNEGLTPPVVVRLCSRA